MEKIYSRRSEAEWQALILDYRDSGLSTKVWCEQHNVSRKCFYYHFNKYRLEAGELKNQQLQQETQEVVEVDFADSEQTDGTSAESDGNNSASASVRIVFPGFSMELTNSASEELIRSTIAALRMTC